MRVGIVCPYDLDVPGGVQQQVIGLERALRVRGVDVRVVGPGPGGAGPARTVRVNRSVAPVALAPSAARRTRRLLEGVDVVHVHEPFVPVVSLAALRSGHPVVATFHADPSPGVRRLYLALRGAVDRLLGEAIVTAVSPVAASVLPWRRVEVIPNAVEAPESEGVERRAGRVAFVGRDEPRKGLDVLLRAWPSIRGSHPSAELVVIGSDRDRVPEGVRMVGRVNEEEKWALLRSATVAVAPNLGGESFGIVVVEQMAAGCAVVASSLPAFRDVAGAAATFVPPGDAAELAAAVTGLLDDPERAARQAERARAAASAFSWSSVVDRYLAAYRRAGEVG